MKKEQLELEVNKLVQELYNLEKTANLEKETSEFLANEAQKLIDKSKVEGISLEEQETICKQMDALHIRMRLEEASMFKNRIRLVELAERFNYLKTVTVQE